VVVTRAASELLDFDTLVVDETAAVYELMSDPDPELTVPGPGVGGLSHPAPDAGVASATERRDGRHAGARRRRRNSVDVVWWRIVTVYDRLVADGTTAPSRTEPSSAGPGVGKN